MAGVYTVTQINTYIKNMFDRDFALNNVSVEGEVSNCKYHTHGHIYFTLKDTDAAISCVMFAPDVGKLSFRLKDGMKAEVKGRIMVYPKNGTYQIYVKNIKQSGQGVLYERFLKLRDELLEMGMFDPAYKKPIPMYAQRIGIVTAETGAAVRDICQVSLRRNPYVELILYPAIVQGENAARSIVKGIETLDELGLDIIIVGRGGGSIEDLWAFNEEIVARAVFDAVTPIISAVGHETDVTICDYVADLRAPTPSAAAELANFEYDVFEEQLEAIKNTLYTHIKNKSISCMKELLDKKLRLSEHDPKLELEKKRQKLDAYRNKVGQALENSISLHNRRIEADEDRLKHLVDIKLSDRKYKLTELCGKLEAMSPLKKISGGFGYITDKAGSLVYSVDCIKSGEKLITRIGDGNIYSIVTATEKNPTIQDLSRR